MTQPLVFKYVCSHCNYETQDRSNTKRHQNSKCKDVEARMIPYYGMAYTADKELAKTVTDADTWCTGVQGVSIFG